MSRQPLLCGAVFVDDCPSTCELPRLHAGEWHEAGELAWHVDWRPDEDALYWPAESEGG